MKRSHLSTALTALALTVAMALPALAADLHFDHVGAACADGEVGTWHFVNNQTGGAGDGLLTVTFDGETMPPVGPDKTLRNVQHWTITGGTRLDWAETDLPGKLVLSDYSCAEGDGDGGGGEPPVDL